jgi:hypothetical protein
MPIVATPELGIPFPFDTTPEELNDFREKARAYVKTVHELEAQGLEIDITLDDKAVSHQAMAHKELPTPRDLRPGAIVNLDNLLTAWDYEVLDAHKKLRNYVTNKLIVESENDDPKIRLRALELLGKTSSVGLFAERVDVTVTHRSVKDIESELRKTLDLYAGDYEEVPAEGNPADLASLDLNAELGELEEVEDGSDAAE